MNYIEHLLIFISSITGYVSISVFASLVGISIRIASSAIGVNICVVTAGIKKYKSINEKREEAWENSIASKI